MPFVYRKYLYGAGLLFFLLFIGLVRCFPAAGEYYARHVYPLLSDGLSGFSSLFPFSVGDVFILTAVLFVFVYLIRTLVRRKGRKRRFVNLALFLAGIYVWFYMAWGMNYFREDFYTRTGISPLPYTEAEFKTFLAEYLAELSSLQVPAGTVDTLAVVREIEEGYANLAPAFGLIKADTRLKAKPMLFSSWLSKVGVTGYMNPFFGEFELNCELLPVEYPAVYAHEAAHRLGISSEAEANFYAWLVCSRSCLPEVRYSGQFLLFGYAMRNAARLLPEEEYRDLLESVPPEILAQYKEYRAYWRNKYSPRIGKIQNSLYNFFLKSNRISSGTRNYSEVVGLVVSWQALLRSSSSGEESHSPRERAKDNISGNTASAPAS